MKNHKKIWHRWEKWECAKAGFFDNKDNLSSEDGQLAYRDFLSDLEAFESALIGVTSEWEYSCEHFLTSEAVNKIAWLGQASAAYAHGLGSCFKGGFKLLSDDQQLAANKLAEKYLFIWESKHEGADQQIHFNLEEPRL